VKRNTYANPRLDEHDPGRLALLTSQAKLLTPRRESTLHVRFVPQCEMTVLDVELNSMQDDGHSTPNNDKQRDTRQTRFARHCRACAKHHHPGARQSENSVDNLLLLRLLPSADRQNTQTYRHQNTSTHTTHTNTVRESAWKSSAVPLSPSVDIPSSIRNYAPLTLERARHGPGNFYSDAYYINDVAYC